jgi:hypothetical protein
MAKRKTRQQKIIADLHRQLSLTKDSPMEKQLPKAKEEIKVKPVLQFQPKTIETTTKHLAYTNLYLGKDLQKTAFLTAGIVLAQIALFFLFKQHILILPGISY